MNLRKDIWILVGTRPEVIKQAMLYKACIARFGKDRVALVGTGQHKELLQQALAHFHLELDVNLEIMKSGQSLSESAGLMLGKLDPLLDQCRPRWVVVQGDTTTAAMAAIAAFHRGISVAHNEAGLRSFDLQHPFPEEANRRFISVVSRLNFAPTEKAKSRLLAEGVSPNSITVTGNPGIDALFWTLKQERSRLAHDLLSKVQSRKLSPVLLTAHRRENAGEAVDNWFRAIASFLDSHQDLSLIYPLHPNRIAQDAAKKYLAGNDRVHLLESLDYGTTCHLLKECRFVVTDSGGIQEEAATLGVPTVVCRNTTERSEAVDAGISRLAGLDVNKILEAMNWAYERKSERAVPGPFGDGRASEQIAEILFKNTLQA